MECTIPEECMLIEWDLHKARSFSAVYPSYVDFGTKPRF